MLSPATCQPAHPFLKPTLWVHAVTFTLLLAVNSLALQELPTEKDPAEKAPPASPTPATPQDPDWARQYIADDPLILKEIITLEDITAGLSSPKRRSSVITLHFSNVSGATDEEKLAFLKNAMSSEFVDVQQQAAAELQSLGQLESFVIEILRDYISSEDPQQKRIAIVAMSHIAIPLTDLPTTYFDNLIDALSDPDETVSQASYLQLLERNTDAVPALIRALSSDNPRRQLVAAKLLSQIVGSKPSTAEFGAMPTEKQPEPSRETKIIAKAAMKEITNYEPRTVEEKQTPTMVTVYFGTNREKIDKPGPKLADIAPYPFLAVVLVVGAVALFRGNPSDTANPVRNHGCRSFVLPFLMLGAMVWSLMMFRTELQDVFSIAVGPHFGPHSDSSKQVHYGTCEVSIPPNHRAGELERPQFAPEDENDHVVLQRTEELEEQVYFDLLKSKLSELPTSQRNCFVFIHGFNVDFQSAARRTAQIHYDLKFKGVPIFFSWPSRASVRQYFSDRTEIYRSKDAIKQFLVDVAERIKADRIHVIAHSMGADATCQAISEMDDRGKVFDQIVLAAPDIDRQVFLDDIVPRITKTANRTTLYCSKNDLALFASRAFNDGLRAGDSSQGALVTKEIDTVDASNIDTDLLGHSYYGDCVPLLEDVRKLIGLSLSPAERQLRPWPVDEQLQYWTLDDETKNKQPETPKAETPKAETKAPPTIQP